jgi:hypothetical protein
VKEGGAPQASQHALEQKRLVKQEIEEETSSKTHQAKTYEHAREHWRQGWGGAMGLELQGKDGLELQGKERARHLGMRSSRVPGQPRSLTKLLIPLIRYRAGPKVSRRASLSSANFPPRPHPMPHTECITVLPCAQGTETYQTEPES